MGEKGNLDPAVAGAAAAAGQSVISRTTEVVTSTVVDGSTQLVDTVRDKAIGAVADETVAGVREKLTRKDDEQGEDGATPPAGEPAPGA